MSNPISLFRGVLVQKPAPVSITDVTPPTFAGIQSLVANADGSLTASWSAATDTTNPITYEVYVQASTATGLFNTANVATLSRGTSTKIFILANNSVLQKDVTYFVGVRARDAVGNLNTNTTSLNAASAGIADNSVFNIVTAIKAVTDVLGANYTPQRAANLDNLDTTVTSRSSQASVDAIQNNTSFVGVVPAVLVLPPTGSKPYIFYANLFDSVGNPEDPDGNTLNVRVQDTSGNVLVATTAMTRIGLGRYSYTYTVNSTDTEQGLVVFFEYSENGIPFSQSRVTEVQEFESKLDTLLQRLSSTRASNLDFLDAAITSRANPTQVTAAVWDITLADHILANSTGRALYDAAYGGTSVTPVDVQNIVNAVWNEARSAHTSPNTFGEAAQGVLSTQRAANLDFLDAAITSRASLSSVAILGLFDSTKINNLNNLDATVSTRAVQGTLNLVKARTDLIPNDPATNTQVGLIPTNPLLTTDSRLSALDAPVSSRAVAADLAPLATSSAMASGFSSVATGLAGIVTALGPKATSAEVANAVVGLSTSTQVAAVGSAVAAVAAAQITVGQIWSYGSRTLTEAVETTVDLTGIARTTDVTAARDAVIDQTADWKTRMTAAIDPVADSVELVAWLTRNDMVMTDADECNIVVQDGDANVVMSIGPDLMIASNGVFKFSRLNASTVFIRNKTYTCNVKIIRNSVEYTGLVPITVF